MDLQKVKEARETGEGEKDIPIPTNQQVEVNQRLQELAQLARCGTLDIAIAIAADSVGNLEKTQK